jgi:hypothetical protein
MPKHDVTFTLPWRPLGKEDVVYEIRQDGELFGTLKVSKGAVVWRPAHKKLAYRLSWDGFDHAATQHGRWGPF